jgi:hypothetical protein
MLTGARAECSIIIRVNRQVIKREHTTPIKAFHSPISLLLSSSSINDHRRGRSHQERPSTISPFPPGLPLSLPRPLPPGAPPLSRSPLLSFFFIFFTGQPPKRGGVPLTKHLRRGVWPPMWLDTSLTGCTHPMGIPNASGARRKPN